MSKLNLHEPLLLREQCYLNGEWCDADDSETFSVMNPATGAVIAHVPRMGTPETRRAIMAAQEAWPAWRKLTAKARAAILRTWFELMLEHQDDLAKILTAEQGKPLSEAMGEILYGASFIEWFAEEAKRAYGDIIPTVASDRRIMVVKEPVGVCAAITPWNFPAAMITRKAGPALAAGCPIIVKPAESTPLTALALAVLAEWAGVPAGIFQVITGVPQQIGEEMTSNPAVRKLSFTGSTAVGARLMAQCAPTIKKLSLELGGNAPFIVFDDADLDEAVAGAVASKYRNAGQTCVCTNRFYVHNDVYDSFVCKLADAVALLKVGPGTQEGVTQGPLINEDAVKKVESHVKDAVLHGGRIVSGGKRHALGHSFFEPTIIADATPAMKVAREETFGPLAPVFRFHSDEEVVYLANNTEFGLAAYFYSRDIGRIWRVAEALEYGMVGVNTGLISNEVAPFGGIKQSGLGREGSHYGLDEYLETKYLCIGGI
ncbi:NAD-dependent succinate-semialdehyde dehydrogenase [Paraburkholderia phenoliruptrix]|uniref:Succinate-semialdehyde dehydrogenase (NADP+) n=2 Tax=Paraburkholderia phenoliruptrix TaxID=252970 RepID=K0DN34_9BURK|nr:NAD-dependent succinate-semialdehyde dehydrogenase [Paraburkholderia phenoliruptrix]AFT86285.1 succinate-semialdehyde dehydrogenase (NADP+) [Paraburkholderia phenoliruptrix BR3459a]CAB4051193.1 Glutarate-semialdehyde dehydrogenase [Paraburkholderia phenoliruptrix]